VRVRHVLAGLALLVGPLVANAQSLPTLTAEAGQERTRAHGVLSPIPLWDTSWWIVVQGTPKGAPLRQLDYRTRFRDSIKPESITGILPLEATDQNGFSGRLLVICQARPEYDRPLHVQLRVVDAAGAASPWVDVDFPVRAERRTTPSAAATDTPLAEKGTPTGDLGQVEVEVSDETTIAEVKALLQRAAQARGGDAGSAVRLVDSTGGHLRFAADVVPHAAAVPPSPTVAVSTPTPPAASDRVLGQIIIPSHH